MSGVHFQKLIQETKLAVKCHRNAHQGQSQKQFEGVAETLSKRFLDEHGSTYFTKKLTRWTWPEDRELLIGRVAEMMRAQDKYQRDNRIRKKRVVEELDHDDEEEEWTQGRPKRVKNNGKSSGVASLCWFLIMIRCKPISR